MLTDYGFGSSHLAALAPEKGRGPRSGKDRRVATVVEVI